jgi:hypothetical protein
MMSAAFSSPTHEAAHHDAPIEVQKYGALIRLYFREKVQPILKESLRLLK